MARPDPDRRLAYQRRAWRLAVMLSDSPAQARDLFEHLMRELPDIERLDPVRLDRMVIMRAREYQPPLEDQAAHPGAELGQPPADAATHALLLARTLPRQAMESWLLRHVDQMDDREIAKAMDCSMTALLRHLDVAEAHMREHLAGHFDHGTAALRDRTNQLDPMPEIERFEAARRRRQLIRRAGLLILLAILVAAAWWFASRML